MMEFFNRIYGYDYPWDKYDQVVVPFGGGAESTTATVMGHRIMYDERGEQDFSSIGIVSHELAHQWWGDLVTDIDDDEIGSKLWLLSRASTTEENIANAEFYVTECLQWMIDDGVAQDIEVTVERQNRKDGSATLAFEAKILQNDGTIYATKYYDLWLDQVG